MLLPEEVPLCGVNEPDPPIRICCVVPDAFWINTIWPPPVGVTGLFTTVWVTACGLGAILVNCVGNVLDAVDIDAYVFKLVFWLVIGEGLLDGAVVALRIWLEDANISSYFLKKNTVLLLLWWN